MIKLTQVLASAAFVLVCAAQSVGADSLIEELRKPGTHLILRHTLAPGIGDPSHFQLDDCATQRNLNDEGRKQASQIGRFLKSHDIGFNEVLSSQWCRCLDTGKLIDMGKVKGFEPLNSVWTTTQSVKIRRTNDLRNFLTARGQNQNLLMLTHQVNILALTGKSPASGEGFVIRIQNNEISVIGYFNTSNYTASY